MTITMRSYTGDADRRRMLDLVAALPSHALRRSAEPFRLCSWALDNPANAQLWEDSSGRLIGYAVLQHPWQTFDLTTGGSQPQIAAPAITWVIERAAAVAAMFDRPFRLFIDIRERDRTLATLVQQAGFVSHDTFTLYLSRTLDDIIPVPQVPLGYQLRLFAGTGEVDEFVRAHRAAFGAAMMTSAWRERMLQLPEYLPELDVVAASSDGRIAAFCLGWLYPLQRIGQIDPIGVDPAFQHAGLAGAVLLEGLWRLQAHRAAVAQVVVYEEDHAARTLFEAAGFRVDERAVTYMMEFRGHDD